MEPHGNGTSFFSHPQRRYVPVGPDLHFVRRTLEIGFFGHPMQGASEKPCVAARGHVIPDQQDAPDSLGNLACSSSSLTREPGRTKVVLILQLP